MKLADFLSAEKLSLAQFAQLAGIGSRQAVHKYATGERIPRPDQMARIVAATGGKVQPGDFYPAHAAPRPESTPAPEAA